MSCIRYDFKVTNDATRALTRILDDMRKRFARRGLVTISLLELGLDGRRSRRGRRKRQRSTSSR